MQEVKFEVTPQLLKGLSHRKFEWFPPAMEAKKWLFTWVCISWPFSDGSSQLQPPTPSQTSSLRCGHHLLSSGLSLHLHTQSRAGPHLSKMLQLA